MKHEPRPSRRLLLGGAATLFGLPFLPSLLPRAARAQASAEPVRLAYVYLPNGLDMATFRPASIGPDYALPAMLMPLAALKSEFSVVTGLENLPANPDGPGDHAAGTSSFITCAHANKSQTEIKLGVSADQVAAQKLGMLTRLPSLQLGIDGGGGSGDCDSGYSCAYARNISWADSVTPLPKIVDPRQAFEVLFEGYDPNASAAEAARRKTYEKSVIDAVLADVSGLTPKLGATDQKKLDQYLTGVRELERRVVDLAGAVSCTPGAPPAAASDLDYPAHLHAMMDLIALAFSCDATRIVSLMFGNAVSGRTHPFLDITRGHHDISHHKSDPINIEQLVKIGTWQMEQLGYLFGKLQGLQNSEGQSLLYDTAIFCSSDISDGNRHNHDDMPTILAGHGGGALTPGKHVSYTADVGAPKQKVSNLLVTMLEAAGVASAVVGDSDGLLPEL